jgi:hypothetical protein
VGTCYKSQISKVFYDEGVRLSGALHA